MFFALQDRSGDVRAAGEVRGGTDTWELLQLLGPGNSRIEAPIWDGVRAALARTAAA